MIRETYKRNLVIQRLVGYPIDTYHKVYSVQGGHIYLEVFLDANRRSAMYIELKEYPNITCLADAKNGEWILEQGYSAAYITTRTILMNCGFEFDE